MQTEYEVHAIPMGKCWFPICFGASVKTWKRRNNENKRNPCSLPELAELCTKGEKSDA